MYAYVKYKFLDDVFIEQISPEIVTVAEGIIPLDPFNDVIRTEPAPNLQSLVGDMNSFFNSTSNSSDGTLLARLNGTAYF